MADESENLAIVLLRELGDKMNHLDAKIDRVAADVAGIKAEQAAAKADVARLDAKVDRIDQKAGEIDRNVDIVIKQQINMQHDMSMLRHTSDSDAEVASQDIGQLRRNLGELT
jgi:hypothetical protein